MSMMDVPTFWQYIVKGPFFCWQSGWTLPPSGVPDNRIVTYLGSEPCLKASPHYVVIQCQQSLRPTGGRGVGEYLQASQSEWDIFIEEDFRTRLENIKDWLGDGVIADYDDPVIEQLPTDVDVPIVGVGGSTIRPSTILPSTISPPITMRWSKARFCI